MLHRQPDSWLERERQKRKRSLICGFIIFFCIVLLVTGGVVVWWLAKHNWLQSPEPWTSQQKKEKKEKSSKTTKNAKNTTYHLIDYIWRLALCWCSAFIATVGVEDLEIYPPHLQRQWVGLGENTLYSTMVALRENNSIKQNSIWTILCLSDSLVASYLVAVYLVTLMGNYHTILPSLVVLVDGMILLHPLSSHCTW